uniref:Apple domain-containing protein n=1 Tax=Ditylenchus dipsaci TaxID=166011 RepID=A0A915DYX3_9BILA
MELPLTTEEITAPGGSSYGLPEKSTFSVTFLTYFSCNSVQLWSHQPAGGPAAWKQQVITGIPDLSDPCFRRYSNSIIVNAQPYERRSSISLVNCKTQCLRSQIGVYSCRSFVYDNVNQVCDLFAHVGDQNPARLLRFQTRDYFEPTAAISCTPPEQNPASLSTLGVVSAVGTQANTKGSPVAVVAGGGEGGAGDLPQIMTQPIPSIPTPPSTFTSSPPLPTSNSVILTEPVIGVGDPSCNTDQVPRFLKTVDFELYYHDDMRLDRVSLDECLDLCANNFVSRTNGSSIKCNSFEFNNNECILSMETAVPLGNGQLKQKIGTDYYEKLCVDQKLANECPTSVYNRYPQMICRRCPSLQHCFDNCLNSKQLYGFKCISGMFYFEEPQLNCILNTEDRSTQPDLFTGENSDLVDYFETGLCKPTPSNTLNNNLRYSQPSTDSFYKHKKDFVYEDGKIRHESGGGQTRSSSLNFTPPPAIGSWSEWSPCIRSEESPASSSNSRWSEGVQTRKKMCENDRICARETRACEMLGRPLSPESSMDKVVDTLRRLKCPMDVCCPVFGGCKKFSASLQKFKKLRQAFVDPHYQFELLVKFDQLTYPIWALQQQALIGDANLDQRKCQMACLEQS